MSLIEKIARAMALQANDYAGDELQWQCWEDSAQAALTAIMGEGDGVQECDRNAALQSTGLRSWDDASIIHGGMAMEQLAEAFARHRSTAAAAERARRGWQPIETAPMDGAYILGFGPHETRKSYTDAIHWWGGRWTITWMEGYGEPTHWMPLPAPPADAIERGEV